MRVLITGGIGRVGTPVTQKFVSNGWDVRVISAEATSTIEGITYTQGDILDYDALLAQLEGCDAVVHLAAIPSPRSHPAPQMFHINVSGTYNVFEAAAKAGVKRVVQASSINALGCFWGNDDRQFDYFPIDEDHPTYTTDGYSFSKQVDEEIAAYYWRREGMSSVSFRFPAVWTDETIHSWNIRDGYDRKRAGLDHLLSLSDGERAQLLATARKQALAFRAGRMLEYEANQSDEAQKNTHHDDWLWSTYAFDRYNLWAYIHTVDSTQAIEKAVLADYEGAHPLFVNSAVNSLNYDSETLLSLFFPDVRQRTKPITDADTLVSYDKACRLIGYQPTYRFV